jgi:hypothetical protein
VGALAHYFEDEGVATTQISLIREHTQVIEPPRALWVPFELGRPLGVASDPGFQKRVLLASLKLLEADSGPVLEDFADDAPLADMAPTVWACPVNFARPTEDPSDMQTLRAAFKQEIIELRPWYDQAVKQRGRTTAGVIGLDMDTIVDFIGAFLDRIPPNPRKDLSLGLTLNFAVDDLKAYYYEAVSAQPGETPPDSATLDNWFWQETAVSKILFRIKALCLKSEDKMMQLVGKILLVPSAQAKSEDE